MRLLVLPGDGIGPEISHAVVQTLAMLNESRGLGLELSTAEIGFESLRRSGKTVTERVIDAAAAADGIILGPVSTMDYPAVSEGGLNPSAVLRKVLGLYANIRPSCAAFWPAAPDIVVVRENTEGFYADRNMISGTGEFQPTEDVALSIRKITRTASQAVAHTAMRLAMERGKRLMVVHKANVLRLTDGLFLSWVREVAEQYPDVALEDELVDAAAFHLVRDPGRFDVILTTNMFGDIVSNVVAGLSGGLGMAPSLNVGERLAMAQATHGSAPDLAGSDTANPIALLASTAMLLRHLGRSRGRPHLSDAAADLMAAIRISLSTPDSRTGDVGGTASLSGAVAAVRAALDAGSASTNANQHRERTA